MAGPTPELAEYAWYLRVLDILYSSPVREHSCRNRSALGTESVLFRVCHDRRGNVSGDSAGQLIGKRRSSESIRSILSDANRGVGATVGLNVRFWPIAAVD